MRKLLLFFFALLTGVSGVRATTVTWESRSGWTQASGGKGALKWFGAMTPGTTDMEYTLDEFQIMHEIKANDSQNCYIAIAKSSATSSLNVSEVIAVSNNRILPTAVQLYTYNFDEKVTLKGGTTYYIVFLTSNTPTDGAYPVGEGRLAVNHNTYGTYTPSTSYLNTWWPYFKATLTTEDPLTDYNYTCKNLAGYELGVSGVYSQTSAPDASQAPAITGYTYQSIDVDGTDVTYTYALATNPIETTASSDLDSDPTYMIVGSLAGGFYYYAEAGGAVKANIDQSTLEDAAHWMFVGDETNGYKIYNARFGSAKVAVASSIASGAEISMLDAASNDGTLFDIRYISGAYRLYAKGTAFCTNRLSSDSKNVGIHSNVNDGSKTSTLHYYANSLYKQSDINTAKVYTIKASARGYVYVGSADGIVKNNHEATAESAAADNYYKWVFVQNSVNNKYYLYNVGAGKFFGLRSAGGAGVTGLSTTDYVNLVATGSNTYYPVQLTGIGYDASYNDVAANYINTQGTSGTANNVVYNNYKTLDGGNDLLITEIGTISAVDILLAQKTLRLLTGGLYAENSSALNAEVTNNFWKVYTIKGKLGTLEANSAKTYLTNSGKSESSVAPTSNTMQQWVLIRDGENYLLYNIGADKYLSNDGSHNYALVDRASASTIQFRASTAGSATAANLLNCPVGIQVGSAWLNLNNGDSFTYGTVNFNDAADANNMFRIEELNGPCYLTSGFYRLKNKLTSDSYGYMGVDGTQLVGNISSANDASTVIYIDKNNEGKFTFQAQGKYTSCVRRSNEVTLGDSNPEEAFAISSYNGSVVMRTHADGDYSYYHTGKAQSYHIVGWEAAADASQWQIEKATSLSVSLHGDDDESPEYYYATFCAPFSYTVGDGATAYTLSKSGDWFIPTPIVGEVTAGTPVLLKGTSSSATLTIGTGYQNTTPLTTTSLTGTYLAATIDGANDYVLGFDDVEGVVGFYHWNTNSLGANRAYYDTPAAPGVKGFAINWNDVDAIKAVLDAGSEMQNSAIFNLAGQRISKLQRGVNIVNGKKVIIK